MNRVRSTPLPPELVGARLDKALVALDDSLSRAAIQRLIRDGLVWIDGVPIPTAAHRLRPGALVQWTIPDPEPLGLQPETIPLEITFEDDHVLVINKPAGMVVHPGAGVNCGTLVHAVLGHCGGELSGIGGVLRPGIVHRLDKDTSGLLVVAKSDAVHQDLTRQFAAHTVQRRYTAIVRGVPRDRSGTIDAPIGRHPTARTKMAVRQQGGRAAITRYEIVAPLLDATLIHCHLQTGRTHQIRVHMAHIGHAVLGDPVYGAGSAPAKLWPERTRQIVASFQRQALHAGILGFRHPITGGDLRFTATPPEDFNVLFESLRK
ncbi:MAG: RluA family pseudouridine synthase [Magnetococcales bacterium]|nr:RluA family pseudouridine synthase [Magnetococcales bacterium]